MSVKQPRHWNKMMQLTWKCLVLCHGIFQQCFWQPGIFLTLTMWFWCLNLTSRIIKSRRREVWSSKSKVFYAQHKHLMLHLYSEGPDDGAKWKTKGAQSFLTIPIRSWVDRRRLHKTSMASNYCINNLTQTTNVKLVAGGKVTGVLRKGCLGARNVQKRRLTLSSPEPPWWWKLVHQSQYGVIHICTLT